VATTRTLAALTSRLMVSADTPTAVARTFLKLSWLNVSTVPDTTMHSWTVV
jgi:hypothetical protein